MNNTVIACVDGSPSTRPVCEYAAWAAGKLGAPLALLHVLEKSETPAVSDLTGSIGIDSREQLTEALVRVEGERSRLLMAQGKAVLAGCAELLKQTGQPDAQLLQKHGALDEILAELGEVRLMVLWAPRDAESGRQPSGKRHSPAEKPGADCAGDVYAAGAGDVCVRRQQ
ncbi:universal stress protein [Klebsiella pneumoniae]|nr:universal stress protein [Klebsiella pneumoniae]